MKKPIRILQISAGSKIPGGVETFLVNVLRNIDTSEIIFDFLSPNETTYKLFRDDILKNGGRIYELDIQGNFFQRKIRLFNKLIKFIRDMEYKYEIVHINSGSFFFQLAVSLAMKLTGIPVCIIHSHNAIKFCGIIGKLKGIIIHFLKWLLPFLATDFYACSKIAATNIFPQKIIKRGLVRIIKNGIDIERFRFNPKLRNEIRSELNIDSNKFLIGHVGRFSKQKNHEFLIDVFKEIHKINQDTILLLVGEGELENEIREKVKKLGLSSDVIFYGSCYNTSELYQAMDVFLFTSHFEGLGIVLIEAQVAGLPCIITDVVPEEASISDNIKRVSLSSSCDIWAKEVLKYYNGYLRKDNFIRAKNNGYDIIEVTRQIHKLYIEQYNRRVL